MARGSGFNATKINHRGCLFNLYEGVLVEPWNGTPVQPPPVTVQGRFAGDSPGLARVGKQAGNNQINDGTRQFTRLAHRASASPPLLELRRPAPARAGWSLPRSSDHVYEIGIFTAS
jgi:hypothetical protein